MQPSKAKVALWVTLLSAAFPGFPAGASARHDHVGGTTLACANGAVRLRSRRFLKLVVRQTAVTAPGMLGKSELHGTVTVEVCIDQTGAVAAVRAVRGHPIAVSSVIQSVRGWSFAPYKCHGRAKSAVGVLKVKYDFRARSHESPPG